MLISSFRILHACSLHGVLLAHVGGSDEHTQMQLYKGAVGSALLCRAVQIPQGGVLTRRQSAALAAAQGGQGEADAKVQDCFHPALPAVAAC